MSSSSSWYRRGGGRWEVCSGGKPLCLLLAIGVFESFDRVVKTFLKSLTSNKSNGSNKSEVLKPKTDWHDWRNVRIFFKHKNCDSWGLWLKSFRSTELGDKVFKRWHISTPSRKVWAKSNALASGCVALCSSGKMLHLTSQSTQCLHSSIAILNNTSRLIGIPHTCLTKHPSGSVNMPSVLVYFTFNDLGIKRSRYTFRPYPVDFFSPI